MCRYQRKRGLLLHFISQQEQRSLSCRETRCRCCPLRMAARQHGTGTLSSGTQESHRSRARVHDVLMGFGVGATSKPLAVYLLHGKTARLNRKSSSARLLPSPGLSSDGWRAAVQPSRFAEGFAYRNSLENRLVSNKKSRNDGIFLFFFGVAHPEKPDFTGILSFRHRKILRIVCECTPPLPYARKVMTTLQKAEYARWGCLGEDTKNGEVMTSPPSACTVPEGRHQASAGVSVSAFTLACSAMRSARAVSSMRCPVRCFRRKANLIAFLGEMQNEMFFLETWLHRQPACESGEATFSRSFLVFYPPI